MLWEQHLAAMWHCLLHVRLRNWVQVLTGFGPGMVHDVTLAHHRLMM